MNPQNNPLIPPEDRDPKKRPDIPFWLILVISFTFAWIFIGISVIIGYRMYWNSPIHPSFALFGAVAFSSVTAFAIVLTLDIVTGKDLSFEFANLKFTGTSGPVTLWILTFLAIMSTFILGDFHNLSKSEVKPNPPLHQLAPSNSSNPSIP
jgi:magnesium-transporting ATPase (P-type)